MFDLIIDRDNLQTFLSPECIFCPQKDNFVIFNHPSSGI